MNILGKLFPERADSINSALWLVKLDGHTTHQITNTPFFWLLAYFLVESLLWGL